jgi:tetratricopeptide (TPR) repeat protein
VDEPTFLFRTGRMLLANGNTLLAATAFQRSLELAPNWAPPRLWLAQSLDDEGNFAEALNVTDNIQKSNLPKEGPGLAQLLHCRAVALRGLGRTNEIGPGIQDFLREHNQHREVLAAAASLYAQNDLYDKELLALDELLAREPNKPEWLSRKGIAELHLSQFDAAISTLTAALSLAPADNNARLCRAVARLGADQLDAAREDYQRLLDSAPDSANALFGLATVAWRKHDTNTAIAFYQQYLSNAIPESPQYTNTCERLRQLTKSN